MYNMIKTLIIVVTSVLATIYLTAADFLMHLGIKYFIYASSLVLLMIYISYKVINKSTEDNK